MNKGIFIRLRESRAFKFIMAFAGVSMLNSLFFPMIAKADGPIAPEFSSFEQVNATQMVDPFTGDFSYNIPLLTVPGPDGGYPINLIYNAGITPDQEASWVGLGWNLNVGAITRQMRGVPDDFDGSETYTKEISTRPNITVEIGGSTSLLLGEIFGLPISAPVGLNIIYNNYKGLGVGYEAGIGVRNAMGLGVNAGISYDPNSGFEKSYGFSLKDENLGITVFQAGITQNSRETGNRKSIEFLNTSYSTVRTDFSPEVTLPYDGVYNEFEARFGPDAVGAFVNVTVKGMFGRTKLKENQFSYSIYGYNNDELAYDMLYSGVRDCSSGLRYPMSKSMKMLAPPIHTHDIYTANAQGLSFTFRPYRSDIPVLNPTYASSENTSNNWGAEFGATASIHWGVNAAHRVTRTSSGVWPSESSIMAGFLDGDFQKGIQPFYYKTIDDVAAEIINDDSRFNYNDIVTPYVANISAGNSMFDMYPQIIGPNSLISQAKNRKTHRDLSSTTIEYLTNNEANSVFDNRMPGRDGYSSPVYNNDNEIGAYTILGEDGSRYEFALPVYSDNTECVFSINEDLSYPAVVSYDYATDATIDNENGKDHFFEKTKIPEYAAQYNLTAVYSADYVDIDNNGPTENDFGNYVKFNYEKKANNFGARYPFAKANYIPGYYSSSQDDKASYTYITREQYYLSKIETKTHVAYFRNSLRDDNRSSSEHNQDNPGSGSQSYRLDRIDLYCKADPQFNPSTSTPIKSIHFCYNEATPLCYGAPGSPTGKLTLERVWFEYNGNTSGANSPYIFSYANIYSYHDRYSDRWGGYKPDEGAVSNLDNPYVCQKSDQSFINDRNDFASVWNLNEIRLPSGGIISVEYEMDDYAYVQDKPAKHMSRILGVGNSLTDTLDIETEMSNSNNRLFFELETQSPPTGTTAVNYFNQIIKESFSNEKYIYFKCFMNLNDNNITHEYNKDYVTGYAQICPITVNTGAGCVLIDGTLVGYLDLELVQVEKDDAQSLTHPIRKAAWQYLYNERPDLFYPDQGDVPFSLSLIQSILTSIQESKAMIYGFYNYMNITKCALNICSCPHLSFIRIPDLDGCMYGGGHRVKSISLTDNWVESAKTNNVTHSYSYKLPDGKSSGVASNEPLTGGDENALVDLLYTYSGENIQQYDGFLVKTPVCRDFYPAPQVGYSRVIVTSSPTENLENVDFIKSGAGYEKYEYYTAKDYPVKEKWDKIVSTPPFEECIPIPCIGNKIYNIYSFSQGFRIVTNNMHGKLKSHATYRTSDNCDAPGIIPLSETKHYYKTVGGEYSEQTTNTLDNTVSTLFAPNDIRNTEIGVTRDFYFDRRSDELTSELIGCQTNTTLVSIIVIPLVVPEYNSMISRTREVTTMKVIHQTGILEKIVSTAEGRTSETDLLAYDAATGQPLWSSTNNEFGKPVYNFSYPAHWYYSGMGLASSNYRFTLDNVSISGGIVSIDDEYTGWFEPGDVLIDENYNKYWVNQVGAVNQGVYPINLINEDDEAATGAGLNLTVIRSGRRNLLSEQCGVEQSLQFAGPEIANHFGEIYFDLLNSILQIKEYYLTPTQDVDHYTASIDCFESEVIDEITCLNCSTDYINYSQMPNSSYLLINLIDPKTCSGTSNNIFGFYDNHIPPNVQLLLAFDLNQSSISSIDPSSARIVSIDAILSPNASIDYTSCTMKILYNGSYYYANGMIDPETNIINNEIQCGKDYGILNAESYEYSDANNFIYSDAGSDTDMNAIIATNPFRYGAKGRWGRGFSYLYYENRRQSNPEIDLQNDGVYQNYTPFDWLTSSNPDWWMTSEVTKRGPDGGPLETKDRLGNYSSLMYGHTGVDRSAIVAAASNCSYFEMGYDGFEDHGSSYNQDGRGHLNFYVDESNHWAPALSTDKAHTGKYSVWLGAGASSAVIYSCNVSNPEPGYFAPQLSNKYVFSAWVNFQGDHSNALTVTVSFDGTQLGSFNITNTGNKVDGWKLLTGEFEMPDDINSSDLFTISIASGIARAYIDDIRIHPLNSQMVSAVYDQKTMRISAILDENNYASFFNYNVQGKLVNVKKETEKGKQTVKASWMNVFKIPQN